MLKQSGSEDPAELIRMAITRIDDQISKLNSQRTQLLGMVSGAPASASAPRRGRPPAAAAKAASSAKPAKKKRKVSAATKAKLKAAAKARWARFRAEKKAAAA